MTADTILHETAAGRAAPADTVLRETLRGARLRRGLDAGLSCVPWLAAAMALSWRFGGPVAAFVALVVAGVAAALAWQRARALDIRWLVRELDSRRPDMEDSADLLFGEAGSMTPLEHVQLARLRQRIEATDMPDLRPRWSLRTLGLSATVAAVVIAAVTLWPTRPSVPPNNQPPGAAAVGPAATQTRLVQQRLRLDPPAYTRIAGRDAERLDAKAPQGTHLQWTLRFEPQPRAVELVFHDGRHVALARDGNDWIGRDLLSRSALYRIVLDGAPPLQPQALYRLDAIVDRPPQLRIVQPERSLTLMRPGQRTWPLQFEASDDYGLADTGSLRITLAQGSGENVTFRELSEPLRGTGSTTLKRFVRDLDLATLTLAVGDDLIVKLRVEDNRAPTAQAATSASLILRWPPDAGDETAALDGLVKKALPAYFRSQRQIILDAEALLKQQRKLGAAQYVERSDVIGVDQRLLRLRYGQFLGEEAEGGPKPPPTSDAPVADEGPPAAAGGEARHEDHEDAPASAATFGKEGAVLEEYGHTHDLAEAATLLDPETRATLKSALDEMWQSELNLRQGHPELALPYAYRALKFIKQVQQASRIYLARVGTELPPIDQSRRLGGDRAGLARRDDALSAAPAPDPTLANLWRALEQVPSATGETVPVDYAALERWLRDHASQPADPLAFAAVMESLRADPDCATCRRELRALLWPLLARPAATVERRDDGGDAGRRYLDALREDGPR